MIGCCKEIYTAGGEKITQLHQYQWRMFWTGNECMFCRKESILGDLLEVLTLGFIRLII